MTHSRIALAAGLFALSLGAYAQTASQKVYIVQLADAPAATYAGGVSGIAATRPANGAKLDSTAPNVRAYVSHLAVRRSAELAKAGMRVATLHNYSYTFNGFSALLTDAQAQALKKSSGVASVVESTLRTVDTTRTPGFLGLTAPGGLWSQLDAASRNIKGEDVIIGVIDTGVWPENASFGDRVDAMGNPVAYYGAGSLAYGPPPAKWKGACQYGQGFSAAMCGNKLIGARYYGTAYIAGAAASGGAYTLHPRLEYISPRDGAGHGTHTASTAGGNSGVASTVQGTAIGNISGIAPRARIAVYKALWTASTTPTNDGGQTADILKAIDDAVADGVDVINYSVSGTQTSFTDAVEISYLNAAAAGVFVAASAGNSGPANQVAHISPWLMTVAASTHDRQALGDFTTGDGAAHKNGVTVYGGTLTAPVILASTIPAAGETVADAQRCFANALDSTAAIGKIVVCDRGVSARVDKSAEVKRVGGVGMVLVNVSSASLVADFHTVPSIHLQVTERASIYAYVTGAGAAASGTISPPSSPPPVVAPVMADFSSRGPNKANPNILKPDITGPGVDILAGYIDEAQSQAQHDAAIAGTYTPKANANSLSGTSMSSPHMAGAAALLRQKYPTWSPAAIKSALMTTTTGVKLAGGAVDTDRWGYGAGHMNPNGASSPSLVYDASPADYGRFMCGLGLTPPVGIGSCATLGSVAAQNLNLASITAASVPGTMTLTRKVTNVSGATGTFIASTSPPAGWTATVSPASLTLVAGATGNFSVTVTRTSAAQNVWGFGTVTWSDGVKNVVSPLSVRAVGFSAPAEVTDTRASGSGTKVVSVVSAYTGSLSVAPVGLVPATRNTNSISTGAVQCYNFAVTAGAQLARWQLFNGDTSAAADLDLDVFNGPNGTGSNVGASGGSTSDEVVTLAAPVAGTYSACVTGYGTPAGGVSYTLSSWVVGPASGVQTLKASAPRNVYAGGAASVALGWSVPAGKRYLGNLSYFDNTDPAAISKIGSTVVFIDNH
jgi:hypothetical protein